MRLLREFGIGVMAGAAVGLFLAYIGVKAGLWIGLGVGLTCFLVAYGLDNENRLRRERLAQEAFAETNPSFPRALLQFPMFEVRKPEELPDGWYRIRVILDSAQVTNREKNGMSLSFGLRIPLKGDGDPEYVLFPLSRADSSDVPANVGAESSLPLRLVFDYRGDKDEASTDRFEWSYEKSLRWLHITDLVSGQEVELPIPGRFETERG